MKGFTTQDESSLSEELRNEISPEVNWFENIFHSSPAFMNAEVLLIPRLEKGCMLNEPVKLL
jgi:hypothetical protein